MAMHLSPWLSVQPGIHPPGKTEGVGFVSREK